MEIILSPLAPPIKLKNNMNSVKSLQGYRFIGAGYNQVDKKDLFQIVEKEKVST